MIKVTKIEWTPEGGLDVWFSDGDGPNSPSAYVQGTPTYLYLRMLEEEIGIVVDLLERAQNRPFKEPK